MPMPIECIYTPTFFVEHTHENVKEKTIQIIFINESVVQEIRINGPNQYNDKKKS